MEIRRGGLMYRVRRLRKIITAFVLSAALAAGLSMPFGAMAASGAAYVSLTDAQRAAIADYTMDMTLNVAVGRSFYTNGDCTSFTSNAILASGVCMDPAGWYYYSSSNASGAWSNANSLQGYLSRSRGGWQRSRDTAGLYGVSTESQRAASSRRYPLL